MKRRTEITIETERLLIIHRRTASARVWCPSCSIEAQMITADEAAQLSDISSRLVYRLIEADELHYVETPDNRLLICLDSFNRLLDGRRRMTQADACCDGIKTT